MLGSTRRRSGDSGWGFEVWKCCLPVCSWTCQERIFLFIVPQSVKDNFTVRNQVSNSGIFLDGKNNWFEILRISNHFFLQYLDVRSLECSWPNYSYTFQLAFCMDQGQWKSERILSSRRYIMYHILVGFITFLFYVSCGQFYFQRIFWRVSLFRRKKGGSFLSLSINW